MTARGRLQLRRPRGGKLRIKRLKMRGPYARVIIAADETINVAEILTPANPRASYKEVSKEAVGLQYRRIRRHGSRHR